MPGRGRALADRLAALLLLAFAVYIAVVGRELTYMRGRVPGPGFAPFWVGVGLGVAALAILVGSWRAGARGRPAEEEEEEPAPQASLWTYAAAGGVMLAAVALVERVGMLTALGFLLVALVRILGGTWRAAVLTAVGLPALFYLLFGLWLKVPLPRGPWGF